MALNRLVKAVLNDENSILTISTYQNNEYGQEIKHYHMHLTPRYKNDNVSVVYPSKKEDIKKIYEILK